MPPTPSRPTRRHAPPGPPRPAAPHDPEAPSDSYSTALTWTPSFPTDEVSGKPGVVHSGDGPPVRGEVQAAGGQVGEVDRARNLSSQTRQFGVKLVQFICGVVSAGCGEV